MQSKIVHVIAKPYRILVVDDNPPFRHLVVAWLRMQDYRVYEAEDGDKALDELAKHPVDLILLDLQMEPMGGLTFMEHLQETDYKTTPVVLITADPSSDILLRISKLGFAGMMKKPIEQPALLKMIAQQLMRAERHALQNAARDTPLLANEKATD